jgi:hypothetical protein
MQRRSIRLVQRAPRLACRLEFVLQHLQVGRQRAQAGIGRGDTAKSGKLLL